MIHIINKKTTKESNVSSNPESFDYSNIIVKKPWGYEYLVFKNDDVAIWLLHIVRKRKTSMHSHPNKTTGLLLLSGNAIFSHLDGEIKLKDMDCVNVENDVFHSTEACSSLPMNPISENGIWLMEIESPPLKTDLVRMEDEYGRKGKTYEGTDNMVFGYDKHFTLSEPKDNEVVSNRFLDYIFKVSKGITKTDSKNTLVSVIGNSKKSNGINIGEFEEYNDFCSKNRYLDDCTILTIEKSNNFMKLSDYIFAFISDLGVKDVFSVCGGSAMHLVDSLGKNKDINYIAVQHEQAGAMAAEAYARITGKPGVCLVTSGPGGTNTITGVCGAWIDSIPTIFISGQVHSNTLIGRSGVRQFGVQESNIVELVKSVTKYAVTITDPNLIKFYLQKAIHFATTGRPGPVWIDIPLDVQHQMINIDEIDGFTPEDNIKVTGQLETLKDSFASLVETLDYKIIECIDLLKNSKRPVMVCGNGIRLSKAEDEFLELVSKLKIPVISSWTSSDLISDDNEFYIGRSGIIGDRASNFTIQNSDLLLIIGSRMSLPQIGYNYDTFARNAKKIMVDIDKKEIDKKSLNIDISINTDAKEFIVSMLSKLEEVNYESSFDLWVEKCIDWTIKYPVVLDEYKDNKDNVNSFHFIDVLSDKLNKDAVIVTDMGTSFTCTMQAFKIKLGQRLFTSGGHASMGFGLPGAIGACFANDRKKTICISGDGALQMNIQELQTLVHYKLPVILFVLNNNGYLTIKLMQQNHFGRYVGADTKSGYSCPDIIKIATAYGIKSERINNQSELDSKIDGILNETGPFICEIMMSEDQPLIPRLSSLKTPDGKIVSKPLEDLYPFLDREEFLENMVVDPVEIIK